MYADVGRPDLSLVALGEAYAYTPTDYRVRERLGLELLAAGRFAEAQPHLHWCLDRSPKSKLVRNALLETTKGLEAATVGGTGFR
jgi:Flp pilus assembly protein TadD